jgi:hypothetical protein
VWNLFILEKNQNTKDVERGKVSFSNETLPPAKFAPNIMKSNTKLHISSFSAANCSASVVSCSIHRSAARTLSIRIGAALSAVALAACGGGGSDAAAGNKSSVSLATVTTGYIPTPTTPAVLTPTSPPTTQVVAGTVITDIRVQNTGNAQTNVPFTFGQVFAPGALSPSEGLAAVLADGTVLRLQTDVKATHADGSVRHAIISGILPSLAAGQTQTLKLAKSSVAPTSTSTVQSLVSAGLSSNVTIILNGVKYTASLNDALASSTPINWLSGSVANETIVSAPLKDAAGVAHPLLAARFAVRWYSALPKQARVEVVVENNKTFTAGARNLTYDVNVDVAGRSVYAKTGLTHYHHSRWHTTAWWDVAHQPATYLQHNAAYLIASKAVPNYDQTTVPAESALADLANSLTPDTTGPMTIGPVTAYMGTTGGRGDIGPLPAWSVFYLLSMDKRAYDAMMAAADGSGTWSMHYRDENTGYPLRTDNEANKRITTHPNANTWGPLPVPRCANNDFSLCSSPYADDTAHQPSLAFLPYLVTGDYYYLEELQFWAAENPLATDPGWSGLGQGLVRWQQLRGQAWSLRTLGQTVYITPDAHPLKQYFTNQLDANLTFYNDTYVVGNPNNLGVYDGSGYGAFYVADSAPWQDDFLTWSFGYLTELGFGRAAPILQWKAKYSVGRMTAPGYCWIQASSFSLKFRASDKTPLYQSFADLYAANFKNDNIVNDNGQLLPPPGGVNFLDLPCGSQEQANYLTAIHGYTWAKGRMIGYADSTIGNPAIMQIALAAVRNTGIPNAAEAWTIFNGRAAKPDYTRAPQFNIVPR